MIKVSPGQLSQEALDGFLAETRNIARIKHPNILRVLEFGVEESTPFLVMDYMPNGSLCQHYPRGTRVPPSTMVAYVRQMAAALQYLHNQGLVHRGVRPERVLLSDFGQGIDTRTLLETEADI